MLYLGIAAAVMVALSALGIYKTVTSEWDSGDGWVALFALSGLVAVVLGVCILMIGISRPVGRNTCANWGRQTGIPTRFVLLNAFDTGTCLARTPGGRWVPNSNWQAFVRGGK